MDFEGSQESKVGFISNKSLFKWIIRVLHFLIDYQLTVFQKFE